ncbi:MAG: hypothetical protein MPW16_13800 [Candidatus Manganitrophus sp.]|nr:MAG: hypothetical protein MPW16_13800 [Candidatus Manganitrophus sp.]
MNNYTLNMSVQTQQGQFLGRMGLSREKTIHCTDCHNTDLFGTYLGGALPLNRILRRLWIPDVDQLLGRQSKRELSRLPRADYLR